MKYLIEILKGYVIGISNIIPGVSGSTMAISMGIYEKLINAINNLKHPIKFLKDLWIYIVGMIIGLVFGVFVISYSLDLYPLITSSLFIGLIIGTIPIISKRIDYKKIGYGSVIVFVTSIFVIVSLPILSKVSNFNGDTNILIYFIIGIISAGTMIIPGVSGSMILMALGYYRELVDLITTTIKACINLNFSIVFDNMFLLISFGIGIIVGIIVLAKLIKFLFLKFNNITNIVILGLIIASPFVVLLELDYSNLSVSRILISIVTLGVGYYITRVFNKFERSKTNENK